MSTADIGGRLIRATAAIASIPTYLTPDATDPELQVVPSGQAWELIGASVTVTTSAEVGNRTVRIEVVDADDNVFYRTGVGANIAASQTGVIQGFTIGGTVPLAAGITVPAGLTIRAVDAAAIDAVDDIIDLKLIVNALPVPA